MTGHRDGDEIEQSATCRGHDVGHEVVTDLEVLRTDDRMRPAGEAAFALRTDDRTAVYASDGNWQLDEATLVDANVEALSEWFTGGVTLDTMNSSTFGGFFKFVSDTVTAGAVSMGATADVALPPPPPEVFS